MKMRALVFVLFSAAASHWCAAQEAAPYHGPIIDMHLHALHADDLGPPPAFICAPNPSWPTRDAKTPGEEYGATFVKAPPCASPLRSPLTDDELIHMTVAIMKARNVTAIASAN